MQIGSNAMVTTFLKTKTVSQFPSNGLAPFDLTLDSPLQVLNL